MEDVQTIQPKKAHSVPVPRLYKVAANILKDFDEGKDSLKNLVFNCRKHPNKKGLYSLVMETVNHKKQLDRATQKIQLFESEPRFNKHLAYVLINELFWGKQNLPGESLPVQTVLKYKKRLKKSIDMNSGTDGRALNDSWPRYARINTLLVTGAKMKSLLKEDGWTEVVYVKEELNVDKYLKIITGLKSNQYVSDFHIPNLLVFPPKSELYHHNFVTEGFLMLQDKSSCFPVVALAPTVGSVVLDACAAPGMKTSQIAAAICGEEVSLTNGQLPVKAKVIAVERNTKRYGLLNEILARSAANSITKAINADFTKLNPLEFSDVEFIVLDPSCSGTGMARRGGGDEEPNTERLENLASLQTSLLLHALSFPSLKRVVYSTCAVSVEENEQVVKKVLEKVDGWKVVTVMPSWERRGSVGFLDGPKFVRALASEDMCNGFFVAVLEKQHCIKSKISKYVPAHNKELPEEICGENADSIIHDSVQSKRVPSENFSGEEQGLEGACFRLNKVKKKKDKTHVERIDTILVGSQVKKEKKRKRKELTEDSIGGSDMSNNLTSEMICKKKKKKLKESKTDFEVNEVELSEAKSKKKKSKRSKERCRKEESDMLVFEGQTEDCNIKIAKKNKKKKLKE